MKMYRMNAGRVRVYIAKRRLGITAFIDRSKLGYGTYYKAMHGNLVSMAVVAKFASVMGCSPEELVVGGGKKRMTNLDRIKRMSAEQMAEFIANHYICSVCSLIGDCNNGNNCEKGIKLWLEQEQRND